MAAVKAEAAPYIDAFRPDPAEPTWLAETRRAALTKFGERGFPSRREEPWRFTSLRALTDKKFPPSAQTLPAVGKVETLLRRHGVDGTCRLVFVDGRLQSSPTELPKGVWLTSTARTITERPDVAKQAFTESDRAGGQPFASLNAAMFTDGFALAVDDGVTLDRPIQIIHVADAAEPSSLHLRNSVALAPNSGAVLIETFVGTGSYWTNSVTNVTVGAEATLTHIKVQDESLGAIHFGLIRATLKGTARYRNFGLTLGALLSRNEVQVLLGDGSNVGVAGAYLQRGEQDATNVVAIDHAAPNATTRELFKGVLDERAHGAFLGTIRVREGARKTDARQTSRALLLSDRASVDTKPELEILADDVKCAHGATVGDLDKAALFYLRARGIGLEEARRLLIEAFVLEAIETVERPELRDHLAGHVRRWLSGESA